MDQSNTKRLRRTRSQIQELLSEFENSNTTVIQFCKTHHIKPPNFYKWKERYKNHVLQKAPSGFAELNVVSNCEVGVMPQLFAEVKGIKIYQAVAASYLKALLL